MTCIFVVLAVIAVVWFLNDWRGGDDESNKSYWFGS